MIVIIGAGIAGLSLAWHLIKSGKSVTVLDQGALGHGASRAATAYLEPRPGVGKMRRLEWQSCAQWPDFAAEISKTSNMDVDYQKGRQLKIAFEDTAIRFDKEHALRIEGKKAFGEAYGAAYENLSAKQALDLEPALSNKIVKAVLLPNVHWLDGRLFCKALALAIRAHGGTLLEHHRVIKCFQEGERVKNILIEKSDGQNSSPWQRQVIACEKLVHCAGVGGNFIKDLPADIPKSRAIRGVAISYQQDMEAPIIKGLIKHPHGILTPRGDGRIIVGATHEEDEAEPIVSPQSIALLKENAERTVPLLKNYEIIEAVAGIRASIGDGMLRLGRSKEVKNTYYALSQGGAGFLRAAIFGDEFAKFINGDHENLKFITPFLQG